MKFPLAAAPDIIIHTRLVKRRLSYWESLIVVREPVVQDLFFIE